MTRREARNLRRRLVRHLRIEMDAWCGVPIPFDGCTVPQADIHFRATGVDPIAEWRGRYTTPRGMRRVMGKGGVPACLMRVARRLGWRKIKPRQARQGDIGLVVGPGTACAVVRCIRRGRWIGRNTIGFSELVDQDVRFAWSVC